MAPFDARILTAVPAARRHVAALAGTGVAQGVATIATAFALARLVAAVVGGAPLLDPALWTGGLFAVRALLGALVERVAARAGVAVTTGLRERLIATWLSRPVEDRPAGERALTLAAQGTTTVEPYVARYLPALVSAAVVPALAIACLVLVDWPSALVVVLTVWLLPVFAALIGATTREDIDRRWTTLSDLSGHFLDVMRGLPTLVSYGRAERQVEVIARTNQRHRRATMRTLRVAFLSATALELLATISVALVAVVVGLRLVYGEMDLLVGLTAILLAPEAYWPVRRVGTEFHSAADGAGALEEILGELEGGDGVGRRPAATPDIDGVRLTDVTYTHPGAHRPTLEAVDLDAGPGLTLISGPSGCGKTTLLELVAGSRRPDVGEVLTGPVHLVTQRPFLGAGSVGDNLTLGSTADRQQAWEALREVGLDGPVAALPDGLDGNLGDDGFGFSSGQRARIVLARALLSGAPVVLLDEPTAHVDADSARAIADVIGTLAATRTVIAVSHHDDLVARADHRLDLTAITGVAA